MIELFLLLERCNELMKLLSLSGFVLHESAVILTGAIVLRVGELWLSFEELLLLNFGKLCDEEG